MITLSIPGFKEELRIEHLMLDFNGTLAVAGKLIDGVREALRGLANKLEILIITGNTFGTKWRNVRVFLAKYRCLMLKTKDWKRRNIVWA